MDFYVCAIEDYHLSHSKDSCLLEIKLQQPENLIQEPRKDWDTNIIGNSIIWAAGGGSYIIGSRYIPLIQRSESAPSNPSKLTIATGLSDTRDELINPKLLIRELFEEIVLVKNNKILLPDITIDGLHPKEIIYDSIKDLPNLRDLKAEETKVEFLNCVHKDKVIVHSESKKTETVCLISKNGVNLNILFFINFPLIKDYKEITCFDTEFFNTKKGPAYLNREIYFYDLLKEQFVDKPHRFSKSDLTPHALKAVNELSTFLRGQKYD